MKTTSQNRKQIIWTISAIGFALVLLLVNAQTAKAQWTTNGNDVYKTNTAGNVGVGTTTPQQKLDVPGGAVFGSIFVGASTTTYAYNIDLLANGNNNPLVQRIQNTGTNTNDDAVLTFETQLSRNYSIGIKRSTGAFSITPNLASLTGSTGIFMDLSGNVGIGTTSPETPLEVYKLNSSSGALTTELKLQSDGAANEGPMIKFAATGAANASKAFIAYQSLGSSFGGNGNLLFGVASSTTSADVAVGDAKLTIQGSGNVGIGTTSPVVRGGVAGGLNVSGPSDTGIQLDSTGTNTNTFFTGNTRGTGNMYVTNNSAATMYLGVGSYTATQVAINSSGYVGIGKNPTVALDVVGSISLTGTVNAKYQDVAEWVPASERLSAGTVVVLDSTKSNQVTSSSVSYDTRVAGVVSAQPGVALGEKSESKVLVATTGRVKVKVDASKGAIHIGDLLVTSDIIGVAMKSEPVNLGAVQLHRPGTLIGKALEPLEKGKGEILVLLSLQ